MIIVKKTRANQITLPRHMLRQAHLDRQEYFQAGLRGGVIYLVPLKAEEPLTPEDETRFLHRLQELEHRERGKGRRFTSSAEAKTYLKHLA